MRIRSDSPDAFPALVRSLVDGQVAIAPGDTMYGIIGVAPDTDAAIRALKGRGEDKPFLLLLKDATWLRQLSDTRPPPNLSRYWPGPLTIVLPARAGGTVAVRVPDSPFLARLLDAVGKPLYSTSVNRSGASPLTSIGQICIEFERDVAVIYDAGDVAPGPPSTLVDVTERPFRVLRKGALDLRPEDLA
jgi:L-threonylcarbamoyladenylate synthase